MARVGWGDPCSFKQLGAKLGLFRPELLRDMSRRQHRPCPGDVAVLHFEFACVFLSYFFMSIMVPTISKSGFSV